MSSEINLLANRNLEILKERKRIKRIRLIAGAVLFFVVFSSVFSFLLTRNFFPPSLKAEENSLLQKMSLLHTKEAKLIIVTDRLKNIKNILKERVSYSKSISAFLEKIPQGLQVEKLHVGQKGLALSVSAESLYPIDAVIKNFTDMAERKELKSLTLESLTFVPKTGKYLTTLSAEL